MDIQMSKTNQRQLYLRVFSLVSYFFACSTIDGCLFIFLLRTTSWTVSFFFNCNGPSTDEDPDDEITPETINFFFNGCILLGSSKSTISFSSAKIGYLPLHLLRLTFFLTKYSAISLLTNLGTLGHFM